MSVVAAAAAKAGSGPSYNEKKYQMQALGLLKRSFPLISVAAINATFGHHGKVFSPTYEALVTVQTHINSNTVEQLLYQDEFHFLVDVNKVEILKPRFSKCPRIRDPALLDEIERIPALANQKENHHPDPTANDDNIKKEADVKEEDEEGDWECGCCMESFTYDAMKHCSQGHLFCVGCLQRHVNEQAYGKGDSGVIKCMDMCGCDGFFPSEQIETCFSADKNKKRNEHLLRTSVQSAGLEGLVTCPKCDNIFVVITPTTHIACNQCKHSFCPNCNGPPHKGSCEEEKRTTTMNKAAEAATNQVIRTCPNCSLPFLKDGNGCNKMTCSRCGTKSCYLCRQKLSPNNPYKHFCRKPHCDHSSCGKCVLFLKNTERADKEARRKVLLEYQQAAADGAGEAVAQLLTPPCNKRVNRRVLQQLPTPGQNHGLPEQGHPQAQEQHDRPVPVEGNQGEQQPERVQGQRRQDPPQAQDGEQQHNGAEPNDNVGGNILPGCCIM